MKQKGKVVEECNKFGKDVDPRLTHPEYFFFADETRYNTLMKKDVHVAGTRYISEQVTQEKHMKSTSKGQFTVLFFIYANGQSFCCIVIFQSNFPKTKLEWGKGINMKVNPARYSSKSGGRDENCHSKKYHGFQTSFFWGIDKNWGFCP